MFAIVEIAGKQFKVSQGDHLEVPKLKNAKEGETLKFDQVLLKSNEDQLNLGMPYLEGASVQVKVKAHGKKDKIRVFKMKAKKRYRRTIGHREQFTQLEVVSVK